LHFTVIFLTNPSLVLCSNILAGNAAYNSNTGNLNGIINTNN